jgi:predicted phage terminase large subunit-like protein
MPAGFAHYAGRGQWSYAPHLHVLNQYLMALMARRITKLIVTMPPQHGKSSFTTQYFSTFYLGNNPYHEVIVAAYEATFAATWGGRCRDLMSEYGPPLWGLTVKQDARAADNWRLKMAASATRRDRVRRPSGGMRTAGIGTGITGRPMHLGIIDDPFKDNVQAMSPTYRQRVWDWYESSFMTRAQPDTVVIVQHTRWHEDDLIGRLLEREPEQWTVLNLPAIAEDEGDALGRERGAALWPGKYDEAFLANVQTSIDPYWWAALYQQRPAPPGGGVFHKAWWKFWHPVEMGNLPTVRVPIEGEEAIEAECVPLPVTFDDSCHSWDLTFDSASSRVAGGVWRRRGANFYLVDAVDGEWEFPQQVDAVHRLAHRHPSTAKLIEDKANARALASTVRNVVPGIILVNPQGDKMARARAVSPLMRAGNVYLPHPAVAPWVMGYINEMAAFPTGRFDDHIDQTSQALLYLERRMHARRTGTTGTTSMSNYRG